jgi:sigma-E factor negative regulatory protein RseB
MHPDSKIKRTSERVSWLTLALAFATVAVADDAPPHVWLERMNQALSSRNYDGVFSHWQGGRVETLRIIHRVKDGEVTERLVSLDGSGREFIRTGTELSCYLPDKRTVLVEQRPQALLWGSLPTFDAKTTAFYEVSEVKRTRLIGREARLISVNPKDDFRYGYRLWIAEDTAMPLKTQLCDSRGRVIEQVIFANLDLPPSIPDSAFKPAVSTDGFRWLRNERNERVARDAREPRRSPPVLWSALKLPPGFRMTAESRQVMPGSNDPVSHFVFTDGLASVSVFVESRSGGADRPVSGLGRMGSTSTFSTVTEDGQRSVTALGEVPPETVRAIADSVRRAEPPPITQPSLAPQSSPTLTIGPGRR